MNNEKKFLNKSFEDLLNDPSLNKKDISRFAYDPEESSGYHGDLTFHKDPVYKNRKEAMAAIAKFDRGWYNDHAVRYRDGRKIFWLVKCEWHC